MEAGMHPKQRHSVCWFQGSSWSVALMQGNKLYVVSRVSFKLELTTPACPIKDEFERKARDYVSALPWVSQVRGQLLRAHVASPAMHVLLHAWLSAAACGSWRPFDMGSA